MEIEVAEATVIHTPEGSPEAIVLELEPEALTPETVEAEPSDAVTIAAIEADKEVQIATIHAEVETARIEQDQGSMEWLRQELTNTKEQMRVMQEQMTVLLLNSGPSLEPEPTPQEVVETIAEAVEIAEIMSETPMEASSETETEALAESVAVEAEPPLRNRPRFL